LAHFSADYFRLPMKTLFLRANDILRADAWTTAQGRTGQRLFHLAFILVFFGLLYGAVMGSYGGIIGQRAWQLLISGVKVPMLLMVTFALSMPSFFIINTLFGLRSDFAYVVRALLATQAGLTIILASFAPFTILWYVSFSDYQGAILFNALMFAIASFAAQSILRRLYQPLIQKSRRHLVSVRIWLVIYAFVGIQMAWVLRPFVGSPDMEPQFFRTQAWGNAYVTLLNIFLKFINGL
jgi:hypothetical protein